MSPKETAYIVERLAVRFMAMVADYERKLVEHRDSFGARTSADAKIIEGLRRELFMLTGLNDKLIVDREEAWKERDGLLTQVQDQRAEIERLTTQMADQELSVVGIVNERNDAWERCDALRAEVAALQARLRASIARGDFAQMEAVDLKAQLQKLTSWAAKNQSARDTMQIEIERLKSQTPKQHPVKVGEWVRRLVPSPACDVGTVARVVRVDDDTSDIEYDVKRIDGQHGVWFAKNCEPCDPPIVKREPTIGDTVRLVKIPIMGAVSPELQMVLEWPWIERWGTLNQTALVVEPAYQLEGALSVCLRTNVHVRWPVCCIEVVSEANHDTEAGKAVAESAVSRPIFPLVIIRSAEIELCVGDEVEVIGRSAPAPGSVMFTGTIAPIGTRGIATMIHGTAGFVEFDNGTRASIKDVRKVTT